MSLFVTSLNSGSNGNCYYVGNETEAVLIDAGISCKEIELRMKRLQLSPSKLKAIFISHEHADHIRGLDVFSRKYSLPVYITAPTLRFGRVRLDRKLACSFEAHTTVSVGSLQVVAFPKAHDASDPYSFTVSNGKVRVGVFTDIGVPCQNLIQHFSQCHAAFLESNYDEEMLDKGSYPYYLKHRIRGGKGHLSNRQALELFVKHRPSYLSHLFLSHLSRNNNCPKLVEELFNQHAGSTHIIIASRDAETPVYEVRASEVSTKTVYINSPLPLSAPPPQLSFDFC